VRFLTNLDPQTQVFEKFTIFRHVKIRRILTVFGAPKISDLSEIFECKLNNVYKKRGVPKWDKYH